MFLLTNYLDTKKCLVKSLFNELKITLELCLNKPLAQHSMQVFVYAIRLCVYWFEIK